MTKTIYTEHSGIQYTGEFTKADPQRYIINVKLCDEVIAGRWNTVMLEQLAKWVKRTLENL